jgi:nucleotide-binding universal stress UspA family protein
MYKKILVPFDGSERAECVLPHVAAVAKGCGAKEVFLVGVTERVTGFRAIDDYSQPSGERLIPEAVGKKEKQAQAYLDKIAKTLQAKGIKTRTEVLLGKPAEEILIYANRIGCDLIIMASHGSSGLSRWTHGTVAERVFRATLVPILMVKAEGAGNA